MTVIQRFGGGLNLNVHFHTLLLDGVFFEGPDGALEFRPLPPPTDDEVGGVLARIVARVQRLLRRRGLDPWEADGVQADPLVDESPALAGISSASVQGRIALGPRAGARVWRLGDDPDAPWVLSTVPRHAHLAGFDLHANVAVPATDRARLEQLCRYLLRPAVAQDRLRRLDDGRVVLTLKSPWADGTRQLLFEPLTLLEKLAALIPRPRINLVVYHGVLAPHGGWRARVVAYGAPPAVASPCSEASDTSKSAPRHWAWAALMRRVSFARTSSGPLMRLRAEPRRQKRGVWWWWRVTDQGGSRSRIEGRRTAQRVGVQSCGERSESVFAGWKPGLPRGLGLRSLTDVAMV